MACHSSSWRCLVAAVALAFLCTASAAVTNDLGAGVPAAALWPSNCGAVAGLGTCLGDRSSICNNPGCSSDVGALAQSSPLGGVSPSSKLQSALAQQPDVTKIVAENQQYVELGTCGGNECLALTVTKLSPAVSAALGNPGHTCLNDFKTNLDNGVPNASVVFNVIVNWFSDGGVLTCQAGTTTSSRRKLLAGTPRQSSGSGAQTSYNPPRNYGR